MHVRLTVRQPAGHAGVGGVLVNIAFVWLLLVKYRCLSSVLATSPPKFPHDLEKIRTVKFTAKSYCPDPGRVRSTSKEGYSNWL